ncbi:hypothetical protein BOTBODRAFT_179095 [Botryobasidium botryosum FD-172 SS1]|uniref:Uncharacterized protein n=1 Tax=Botryobasidium botryosum (strain FD-172 SS1) TaxID=930990 RepID=A0A067MC02_BOTB1|nr:hypothetical protein BOTBODRAFT_179095 [Botryobasidium botryosum FD-172 SS1]
MRHAKAPLSAAFKPLSPIALEAQASGLAVIKHINRVLAPSHFQLKGCTCSPFGNFIATPHSPEDVDRLPGILPRILQDMFKVPFLHLTFDLSSLVVIYNLPLGPPGNWADPTAMALVLMAQNNYTELLPASPGCWLANPNCHKGATTSLRLSLSPQAKAAILKLGRSSLRDAPTLFAPLRLRKPNLTSVTLAGDSVIQRRGAVGPPQSAAPAARITPPTTILQLRPMRPTTASSAKVLTPPGHAGASTSIFSLRQDPRKP